MSNHPEDDSAELKPGDVIYINEPKPKPEPTEPKTEPKPRSPTFDIPPAEDKKPAFEARRPAEPKPRPPTFDIPPAEDKKVLPAEPEEEEVVEADPPDPEPPVIQDSGPLPEPDTAAADEPQDPPGREELPRPTPVKPKLQPLGDMSPGDGVSAPSGQQPRLAPLSPAPMPSQPPAAPAASNLNPAPSLAPLPAVPPPVPLTPPPSVPPLAPAQTPPAALPPVPAPSIPPLTQPGHLQPGQDFSFISPQAAVAPAPAAPSGQEALKVPPAASEAPPFPLPPVPALPTTDLQGSLVAEPVLAPPVPPGVLPVPAAEEEERPEAVAAPPGEKSNRGLKIFGAFTLLVIVATVVLGTIFFGPKLWQLLGSSRLDEAREFEHVLVNLLQVENQEIEIKLTECGTGSECSQLGNIVPDLPNQSPVSDGRVSINGTLKVKHSAEMAVPAVSSEYKFDLSLQTDNGRENFVLDIAAVFTADGEAYFKLDDLKINDRSPVNLEETAFAGRWSDLEALLQAGTGGESAVLEENESVFLNYIANLLDLYSYPHYVSLLPVFNISKSQDYNQAREILLGSGAYDLDSGSCRSADDAELTCRLTIDYAKLHAAYEDIYEVLGQSMPAHYGVLEVADDPSHNLPEVVEITFDKDRDYPVSISVPQSVSKISASNFSVIYKSFDEAELQLRTASDPLAITEYHEQLRDYEEDINFNN